MSSSEQASGLTLVKSSEVTSRKSTESRPTEARIGCSFDTADEEGKDDGDSKDEKNAEEDLENLQEKIYVGRLAPTPSGYMHGNSTVSSIKMRCDAMR